LLGVPLALRGAYGQRGTLSLLSIAGSSIRTSHSNRSVEQIMIFLRQQPHEQHNHTDKRRYLNNQQFSARKPLWIFQSILASDKDF
jgi:hypothetical protein